MGLCCVLLYSVVGCSSINAPAPEASSSAGSDSSMSTTAVGTLSGALIGAGLGALAGAVGDDVGEGFVLGSLLGAGTGAFVGRELEEHRVAILSNREFMERQGDKLDSQDRELEELRRNLYNEMSWHLSRTKSAPIKESPIDEKPSRKPRERPLDRPREKAVAPIIELPKPLKVDSKSLKAKPEPEVVEVPDSERSHSSEAEKPEPLRARLRERSPSEGEKSSGRKFAAQKLSAAELAICEKAGEEAKRARGAKSKADKLFYYQRALRLCPKNPSYHMALGKLYISIGRTDEARYEFGEALKLVPADRVAADYLKQLENTEGVLP